MYVWPFKKVIKKDHKLVGLMVILQPIICVYRMTSHQRDEYKHSKRGLEKSSQRLYLTAVTSERPIGFKGRTRSRPQSCPAVGRFGRWAGLKVQGNKRATGSEAGWSIYRRNEALLPNLRAQRHREVLFTLSSRFSVGSVESSCVAIDWFCVCTADHT